MNTMEVHIISKQTIKPSSPTPPHLKVYKLSLLDQLSSRFYIARVIFYTKNRSDVSSKNTQKSENLKTSLSKTLTQYYPFAGRLKDGIFVDCNDDGVELIEAEINSQLCVILKEPKPEDLHLLFPNGLLGNNSYKGSLVVVQMNYFQCGAIGISVCISHKIADACTLCNFIKDWANMARENGEKVNPVFISARSCSDESFGSKPEIELKKHSCVTRRFVFNASSLSNLKVMVADFGIANPTRTEIVSALLYKSALSVYRKKSSFFRPSMLIQTVNMRGKIVPPLPKNSVGNFCWHFTLSTTNERKMNLGESVSQMRKEMYLFYDKYGGKMKISEWFMVDSESMKEAKGLYDNMGDLSIFSVSSMCRFPFYEVDFGWGRPVWVAIAGNVFKNTFVVMDAPCGGGIEAWVTLDQQEMDVFESDEELLEFCSLNPSVLMDIVT